MNFKKALFLLHQGHAIRRSSWSEDCRIEIDGCTATLADADGWEPYHATPCDLLADDWEAIS